MTNVQRAACAERAAVQCENNNSQQFNGQI